MKVCPTLRPRDRPPTGLPPSARPTRARSLVNYVQSRNFRAPSRTDSAPPSTKSHEDALHDSCRGSPILPAPPLSLPYFCARGGDSKERVPSLHRGLDAITASMNYPSIDLSLHPQRTDLSFILFHFSFLFAPRFLHLSCSRVHALYRASESNESLPLHPRFPLPPRDQVR